MSGFNKNFKDGTYGLRAGPNNATKAFESSELRSGGGGGGGSFYANSLPLAYWNFDQGSGGTVNDVSSAGNSLNGTKSSNDNDSSLDLPAWDTTNKVRGNSSLLFVANKDEAVVVPDNNLLDFNTDDTFSISCWLKRSGGTPNQEGGFVVKMANTAGSSNDSAFKGYALYTLDTLQKRPAFLLLHHLGDGDFLRVVSSDANLLNDTNFHNLVVTYNGNSDLSGVKMYLDGSAIAVVLAPGDTDTLEVSEGILTNTALAIGGFIGNPDATDLTPDGNAQGNHVLNFDGNMDEVAIWTKVLSAAEVTAIYNSGNGVDLTNGIPDDD